MGITTTDAQKATTAWMIFSRDGEPVLFTCAESEYKAWRMMASAEINANGRKLSQREWEGWGHSARQVEVREVVK